MKSEILIKNSPPLENFSENEEGPESDESKDSIDFNEKLSFFNDDQANDLNEEQKYISNLDLRKTNKDLNEKKEKKNGINFGNNNSNQFNSINRNTNNSILLNSENYFTNLFNIGYKDFLSNNNNKIKNVPNNQIKNNINENIFNYDENSNNSFFSNIYQTSKNITNINNININNINIQKYTPPFNSNTNNMNINISQNFKNNHKIKKNSNSNNYNDKKRFNTYNNEIINFKIFIENLNTPLDIFICSQTGSRMLQNNLKNFPSQVIDLLIDKIKNSLEKIMCDIYGNYFSQKLYSRCSLEQRILILDSIKDSFITISKTKSGSHVAQSLIEQAATSEEKNKIMLYMKNYELEMGLDTEGTHVLQKIIQIFPENDRQSLTDVLCKSENVNLLCKDLKGISVIKRLICFNKEGNNRNKLVDALYDNCLEIVKTSSGSYILQFLLEEWGLDIGIKLIFFSIYNFEIFSAQKHGANFMNKIIILCLKKYNINRYFGNEQNMVLMNNEIIIINALKNLIFDFNKIVNVYKSKYAKSLIFNVRKLFTREENEKLYLYIKSLESLPNKFDNKKYQIYSEIYKSHLSTL